jgi:hypothetical protein
MGFKTKLLLVALASALPMVSAHAQSAADLQKEISALRAQLQLLQKKVEEVSAKSETAVSPQQVNRIEQKIDLAEDTAEKSGFKGLKFNGVIEAGAWHDSQVNSNNFSASSGSTTDDKTYSGFAMVQISKDTQGDGVDWTLRMLPGADAGNMIHEASVSIPLTKESRVIGGMIPDFQGYEWVFPHANATLGNQLISHNALYDLAGATQYAGLGTSHALDGGKYAVKWLVGNVDPSTDTGADTTKSYFNGTKTRSVGLAYRGDWFINEYAYVGLSGLHGSVNRNFRVMAIDGGYTRGDWLFNGQLSSGWMRNGASNLDDAEWHGVSGLVGFKMTPRLQLLARADYLINSKNGGGTYVALQPTAPDGSTKLDNTANGLGPIRNADGLTTDDASVGANLSRLTLGTNYQINANAQWKMEYRVDTSTGYNFVDRDLNPSRTRTRIGTAFVLSF